MMQILNCATSIQCDAVVSDAVLQAARAAIPQALAFWWPDAEQQFKACGPRNAPLMPLLVALLDATKAVACAVADNAWDDSCPMTRELAESLSTQAYRIGADITNAAQCPDAKSWSQ